MRNKHQDTGVTVSVKLSMGRKEEVKVGVMSWVLF